jgi:uncharacterized membrane protein YeiH
MHSALVNGPLLAVSFGHWQWKGDFTILDLIAASTNALNGAILARRPDHYKNFTIAGILLMAIMGGIGGGVTRDIILNKIPGAFTNPAYITLCIIFGIVGYLLAYDKGQLFREGLFQFMTSFSLPWYAIVGAQASIAAGLPIIGALLIAVIAPTAGRWLIDVSSGVAPKQFVQGEWFTGLALLTGAVWIGCYQAGLGTWAAAGIAFVVGFGLRLTALYRGWEEPLAKEPKGVYRHSDGRPLLGRKIAQKSEREMHDLGLSIEQ